ncbi:ethanolamine ammonia-lyase subunit EutC [Vibrio ostreicida]|uniref:ethanolamine ammonia-lyase subunit EutC n=1 Tax=Vibrio ostreicida TaxID=526588 RepID=UPI003B5BDEE6
MAKTKPPLQQHAHVTDNPWQTLRDFTSARIALGRSGTSIPTDALLSFQLDHAQALDAVHCQLDTDALVKALSDCEPLTAFTHQPPQVVDSQASDRLMYLQRPDLGRLLYPPHQQRLYDHAPQAQVDLAIVIADGLSALAVQTHAVPVIRRLVSLLHNDHSHRWTLAPVTIVRQGRVAVGDDVGECLQAKVVMMMIGERPGLTSPDSLGMYFTWHAKRGTKDADRNCISNVRPQGLDYDQASQRAFYLLDQARRLERSGITLKDHSVISVQDDPEQPNNDDNFLMS